MYFVWHLSYFTNKEIREQKKEVILEVLMKHLSYFTQGHTGRRKSDNSP
jgi:hypothetical protein